MTVIGLCGLNGSGKSVICRELVEFHKFKEIIISNESINSSMEKISFVEHQGLHFKSMKEAIDFVTSNWRENYVISCLQNREDFESFLKRPFFMVIAVQTPVRIRFARCIARNPNLTLEELIKVDDSLLYENDLVHIISTARLTISNGSTIEKLKELLSGIKFDEKWLRPTWDAYFMEMAELASRRSNCMKRGVGSVIVKDKRVVATGYNGTARGLINCCDGGCPRCNGNAKCGVALEHCYCLHAEENALLEAGRVRCEGATLYCTTAPCLGCSQKIIQCGIIRVVYAREYSLEHNASNMLSNVGVILDKFTHVVPRFLEAASINN